MYTQGFDFKKIKQKYTTHLLTQTEECFTLHVVRQSSRTTTLSKNRLKKKFNPKIFNSSNKQDFESESGTCHQLLVLDCSKYLIPQAVQHLALQENE